MQPFRAVKGMNDILSEQSPRWLQIENAFRDKAGKYGYGEIRTPIVEPTSLFARSIGEGTDIVQKEMYTFSDKADKSLTMRPEGTASAVRAYLQHSVQNKEAVTKWIYLGPMYRRERPAKGRYRQFYQLGAELIGDPGPYSDAEMIDMVVSFLNDLGIEDIRVLVNSLGGSTCRARYRAALKTYFEPFADKLCEDCQRRLQQNPLRLLDCKVESDIELAKKAPLITEHLSDEDAEHYKILTNTLNKIGTPFEEEPRLVRGLDYYTRTLFEVQGGGSQLGAQNALCGGGRYDSLVKTLGGPDIPAIGFAMGIERLLLAMPEATQSKNNKVFIATNAAHLLLEATILAQELRQHNISVDSDLRGSSLKSQLRRADKRGARYVIVLGDDEVKNQQVQFKDLQNHTQKEVARAEVVTYVQQQLAQS